QRANVEIARLRDDHAGVELRYVEQRGKKRFEGRDRRRDPLRKRRRVGVSRPFGERLREHPEGVQRLSKVVARGGEKARLRTIRSLGRVLGNLSDLQLRIERGTLLRNALLEVHVQLL